jgi:hypothetical protein
MISGDELIRVFPWRSSVRISGRLARHVKPIEYTRRLPERLGSEFNAKAAERSSHAAKGAQKQFFLSGSHLCGLCDLL